MRSLRPFLRATGGASAVEFALLIGPLLMLMLAVLDFGRLMWTREALQETAAAGARCMGMTATNCASGGSYNQTSTTTYVEGVGATWGLSLAASDIALNSNTTCAGVTAPNGFSSVTITYAFQTIAPIELSWLAPFGSGSGRPSATACFPNNS